MCGLAGWISTLPERFSPPARATLAAMQGGVDHRGPDGRGAVVDPPRAGREVGAALGFTRLAIRDLRHGAQPMVGGPAASVIATMNGELYDTARIDAALVRAGCQLRTRCDAERFAHGAAVWGPGLLPRLEGMFAGVVWQRAEGRLWLARDAAGQKPLYLAAADGGRTAVWGSELGAILAHPGVTPELDPRGLRALLWLDQVPAPGTLLRGVYKLPAGAVWTLDRRDDGRLRLTTARWRPDRAPRTPPRPWSAGDAVDALDAALTRAVERRLVSDVPLGVFLSGGVDSSLVAERAARAVGAGALTTLSIRFEEASFDESGWARDVAKHLGTRHVEIAFSAADGLATLERQLDRRDEPLADPSLLVTEHLCAAARRQITVALGGDGGDEAWLGYPTFTAAALAPAIATLPAGALRAVAAATRGLARSERNLAPGELVARFAAGLPAPWAERHLTWIGGLPLPRAAALTPAAAAPGLWDTAVGWAGPEAWVASLASALVAAHADPLDRQRALLADTYLADGVLQKVDRASMAHGLEVRAPWLDRDVRALAWQLRPGQLRRRGRGKQVPRALAARSLPAHVASRRKKGFGVPLSAWLRGPLRAPLRDDTGLIEALPGIDPRGARALIDAHLAGRADHRKGLLALWRTARWWRACSAGQPAEGRALP